MMMPKIKKMVIDKNPGVFKFGNEEHQKIYKCIANKDGDGAFLSMVEHMDSATKHVYETHIL
jgi:DNA-binding FadR family transcriptional regulator